MIFSDKKSALVRLSDSLKVSLDTCADTTRTFLEKVRPCRSAYDRLIATAREAETAVDEDELRRVAANMLDITKTIPETVTFELPRLQGVSHSQALSSIVVACFAAESYINSFAHFIRHSAPGSLPISRLPTGDSFDRLSTVEKWKTVGDLATSTAAFDRGRRPLQDLAILFRFRNDHAHDKVVELSSDRSSRYNGMFPDPVFGTLDLGHAIFAAEAYWEMVEQLHRSIGVIAFQGHYNLSPWHSAEHRRSLTELTTEYRANVTARRLTLV